MFLNNNIYIDMLFTLLALKGQCYEDLVSFQKPKMFLHKHLKPKHNGSVL